MSVVVARIFRMKYHKLGCFKPQSSLVSHQEDRNLRSWRYHRTMLILKVITGPCSVSIFSKNIPRLFSSFQQVLVLQSYNSNFPHGIVLVYVYFVCDEKSIHVCPFIKDVQYIRVATTLFQYNYILTIKCMSALFPNKNTQPWYVRSCFEVGEGRNSTQVFEVIKSHPEYCSM